MIFMWLCFLFMCMYYCFIITVVALFYLSGRCELNVKVTGVNTKVLHHHVLRCSKCR